MIVVYGFAGNIVRFSALTDLQRYQTAQFIGCKKSIRVDEGGEWHTADLHRYQTAQFIGCKKSIRVDEGGEWHTDVHQIFLLFYILQIHLNTYKRNYKACYLVSLKSLMSTSSRTIGYDQFR